MKKIRRCCECGKVLTEVAKEAIFIGGHGHVHYGECREKLRLRILKLKESKHKYRTEQINNSFK